MNNTDDPNQKWELPPQLRIDDPTVLANAEAMRIDLAQRVNSPFATLSPQEQERSNAAIIVEDLKKAFVNINLQITAIVVNGTQEEETKKLQELRDARSAISARMAEAYASLGRFDLAAEWDPRPESRAEYLQILEAINKDDEVWCSCAPGRESVLADVYSLRHGTTVSVRRCSGCGLLNATALPKHLAEQRAHRAKAAAMVAGKTPEEAKAILMAAGHTSERLLPK